MNSFILLTLFSTWRLVSCAELATAIHCNISLRLSADSKVINSAIIPTVEACEVTYVCLGLRVHQSSSLCKPLEMPLELPNGPFLIIVTRF